MELRSILELMYKTKDKREKWNNANYIRLQALCLARVDPNLAKVRLRKLSEIRTKSCLIDERSWRTTNLTS